MYPDLHIETLIHVEELFEFKIMQPIYMDHDIPVFLMEDLEKIAMSILAEIVEVEKRLEVEKEDFKLDLSSLKFLRLRLEAEKKKNKKLWSNSVFQRFIEVDLHKTIYLLSTYKLRNYHEKLDHLFRVYYFEYRLLAYLSKHLYYKSIHYDKKDRLQKQTELSILDQPANAKNETSLIENIPADSENQKVEHKIEDFFS